MGIEFLDPLHTLLGHGQKKRRLAVRPGGRVRLFGNKIKTQPVLEHHGFKNLKNRVLKLFLLFRHVIFPPLGVYF